MDMSVALIVRLVDQLSRPLEAMGGKLDNFRQRATARFSTLARGLDTALRPQFSGDAYNRNLDLLDRRVDQTRSRLLGAAGMVAAVFAPLSKQMDFEDAFVDFANVAQIPVEKQAEVERRLVALTRETGKNRMELLEIVKAFVGKGMDMDAAFAALRPTGRSATAERVDPSDMAKAGFAVVDNLGVAAGKLQQAFDIMAASGKEGSFELKDMARNFPSLTASARSLQMQGVPAVAALSAALQVAMKSAGSPDEAANNMANFLGKLTSPETLRNFKKMNIDLEKEMKGAAEKGVDPLLHSLELIEKATGGDQYKMGQLFADKQVLDFLRAVIPNLEEYKRIRDEAAQAGGIVDQDFANVAGTSRLHLKGLVTEIDNLLASSGALLPILNGFIDRLTATVASVNEWTRANPELTATILKVVSAALLLSAAGRVAAFAWALTGRQLFRLIGLFYRFDEAGRNVSALARAGRLLSGAFRISGLARFVSLLASIGRGGMATLDVAAVLAGTSRAAAAFGLLRAAGAAALSALAGLSAPVIAAMAAIAASVLVVWKYWQRITAFASGLGSGLWQALAPDLSFISSAWSSLVGSVRGWVGDIAASLGVDAQAAMRVFDRMFDFSGMAARLAAGFATVRAGVADFFSNLFSQEQLSGQARASVEALGRNVGLWLGNALKSIATLPIDLGARLAEAFNIDLSGAAAHILDSFRQGFVNAWASVEAWVREKTAWLKSAFTLDVALPDWMGGGPGAQPEPARKPFQPAAPTMSLNQGVAELAGVFNGFSKTAADAGKQAGGAIEDAGRQAGGSIEQGADRAGARLHTAGVEAGGALGSAAAQHLQSAASSAGSAFGAAAAAQIRAAAANIRVSAAPAPGRAPNIAAAKAAALHDGVDE